MSVGLEHIRRQMADYLNAHGVPAALSWPGTPREERGGPVVLVSLRGCRAGPAGFHNYMGERFNPDTGHWEEVYGRKAELTFGLDLYAASATQVQRGLDLLTDALQEGPGGFQPLGFSAGETVYKSDMKRYFCPVEARFGAWAVAVTREDGSFLDFEVKGDFQP